MSYKNKEFISVSEAAKILGISRMQITRWIKAGKLKAQKVGRSYIIKKNDIGGIYKKITDKEKNLVEAAVKKTLKEYGDVIKKLGKE